MNDFKTKSEIDREIDRLITLRETLPEATRKVTEGWLFRGGLLKRWNASNDYICSVTNITERGLRICTHGKCGLDGIAHDDSGRIKVIGYVNVEDLEKELASCLAPANLQAAIKVINKLKG